MRGGRGGRQRCPADFMLEIFIVSFRNISIYVALFSQAAHSGLVFLQVGPQPGFISTFFNKDYFLYIKEEGKKNNNKKKILPTARKENCLSTPKN